MSDERSLGPPTVTYGPLHDPLQADDWACTRPEGPWTVNDWFEPRCDRCFLALRSLAVHCPDDMIEDHRTGKRMTVTEAVEVVAQWHTPGD